MIGMPSRKLNKRGELQCTKCDQWKAEDLFALRWDSGRRHSWCRKCRSDHGVAYKRLRREANQKGMSR